MVHAQVLAGEVVEWERAVVSGMECGELSFFAVTLRLSSRE